MRFLNTLCGLSEIPSRMFHATTETVASHLPSARTLGAYCLAGGYIWNMLTYLNSATGYFRHVEISNEKVTEPNSAFNTTVLCCVSGMTALSMVFLLKTMSSKAGKVFQNQTQSSNGRVVRYGVFIATGWQAIVAGSSFQALCYDVLSVSFRNASWEARYFSALAFALPTAIGHFFSKHAQNTLQGVFVFLHNNQIRIFRFSLTCAVLYALDQAAIFYNQTNNFPVYTDWSHYNLSSFHSFGHGFFASLNIGGNMILLYDNIIAFTRMGYQSLLNENTLHYRIHWRERLSFRSIRATCIKTTFTTIAATDTLYQYVGWSWALGIGIPAGVLSLPIQFTIYADDDRQVRDKRQGNNQSVSRFGIVNAFKLPHEEDDELDSSRSNSLEL